MSGNTSENYDVTESSEEENNLIGNVLNNKYVLLYEVGRGAFAKVYLTLNISNKKYYAIKIQNEEDIDSALEEIDLLKKFGTDKCKNLNTIIEHFSCEIESTKYMCIVLQLMAGSTYDIMRVGSYINGLPLNTVKCIIKQLLLAMDTIQSKKYNIMHSDIKPENILVVGQNNKIGELINIYNEKKFMAMFNTTFDKKVKFGKLNYPKIKKTIQELNITKIEKKYSKDKNNSIQYIDDKYLKNIDIKLADFGNCRKITHNKYDIQTRHYRAPEIILGYEYNEKCDMWSVGCVLFELLTGVILFNPKKSERFNTNRTHVFMMISLFGNIPHELIEKSKYKTHFFKVNGQLKGDVPELKYSPLYQIVRDKLKDKPEYNDENLFLLTDLLYKLFNYDPIKRPSAREALTHKFLL